VTSDRETGVIDDDTSTPVGDADDGCDQPDISMFPFVTVSPCRRKATPPAQRQTEVVDDCLVQCQTDNVQLSSSLSSSNVSAGSCGGCMSPPPTVSSTRMSPAWVTSCTTGSDTSLPGSNWSTTDSGRVPQISPGGIVRPPRVDVSQSPETASCVVVGTVSPTTSTPAAGARVDVIKVPVYSPVYRDRAASPRRHSTRPASPRRCPVVTSNTDVLDLSPSSKPRHQHSRPGANYRRAIAFWNGPRDRRTATNIEDRDEQTAKPSVDPRGSLNRQLSVSTDSPTLLHHGGGLSKTPVVVCERHEADSASLSPSKPSSSQAATIPLTAATTVQTPTSPTDTVCSSRLVVNLKRCDSAPTTVALPGRAMGAAKRRHIVGSPPSTSADQLAAPSKRRRLKLMCNGMTIYRDIDDVGGATARVRTSKCVSRRRASLPTFPVASQRNSGVIKRRHLSTDDDTSQSRDPDPFLAPDVEAVLSKIDGSSTTSTTTTSTEMSCGDSGIGPLDYSTDRSSIGTVSSDVIVPASVADSSLAADEPLELTTEQVRERQKIDCRQAQIVNQFAVC